MRPLTLTAILPMADTTRWLNFEGTVKETAEKLTVTMDRPMWILAESKP